MMTFECTVPLDHKEGLGAKLTFRMPDGINGAAHTVLVPAGAAPGARLLKVKRPQGMAPGEAANIGQVVRMSLGS